jgi:hypothetical protein
MSLMPCFDRDHAFEEGIVIGRLLAGYGEIELQMCMCLIVVEGILDVPIRTIFGKRGAEERIKIGKRELEPDFGKASLLADLTEATADLDWCRQIRNQYSHCQWYWTAQEGLCFVNLEELAKQPTQILSVMGHRHPVDVPLLQRQEDFFGMSNNASCIWRRRKGMGSGSGARRRGWTTQFCLSKAAKNTATPCS